MRAVVPRLLWAGALVALGACKDPDTAAAHAKVQSARELMAEGNGRLAAGDHSRAVASFQRAASAMPADPNPWLSIAEAHRQSGNDTAAILALKHAEELSAGKDPALRKQIADLYRRGGMIKEALATWEELRDAGRLSRPELLKLAQLEARSGAMAAARKTVAILRGEIEDDPEAKVVEAEISLLAGEELVAAKSMDELLTGHPALTSARLLRARYFLTSGYPDLAEQDLGAVAQADVNLPEVAELRARALVRLSRAEEAVAVLEPLVQANPREVALLAQLAEIRLELGQGPEAQVLVQQALAVQPRFARALYVRGRAHELQGEVAEAVETYREALETEPGLWPALSRLWRIQFQQGEQLEAMSTLERLWMSGGASLDEKVTLAELYADRRVNLDRGRKLIDEALKRQPKNARYKAIRKRLGKARPSSKGVVIMRGR